MPVRYDIAAQVPQVSGGGFDPLNAFAQMQAMDYRQQQNALAQMQMQEYQRKMQIQNALGGVLADPGFDVMSPQAVSRLVHSGNLPEGLSVLGAQRQAAALRAQEVAQQATAGYHTGMLNIAQAKLPFEQKKIEQEALKEERLGASAKLTGEKTALERDAEMLKNAENQAAKIVMANGKGYDKFYGGLDDNLKNILPPQYDEEALSNFTTQMATVQENLKRAHEYDLVDRINPQTGLKEKVAVPKYAPEKGGKPVAGTQGIESPTYSFSQGPGGTMFRGDPRTGMGQLFTPGQPGMPMPANAMAPAPLLPQTSFTNAPPPTQATPPQGVIGIRGRAGAEPAPTAPLGSTERGRQDVMQQVLQAGGYNPDTGVDIVEPLLSRASSGMLSAKGTDIGRMFGANSAAAQADTELKRVSADLTQAFAGNRLATAGVAASEADRFEKQAADIGNPNLTIGERLAAYRGIKRNATRLLGSQYINPFDKSGMTQETMIRARVEETPEGEFTVPDPDGGVHRFGTRKQAAEFLSYVQRMTLGKR